MMLHFKYVTEAVKADYPFAFYLLALHHGLGEGVGKNTDLERRFLEDGARRNVGSAMVRLVRLELEREATTINFNQTAQYIQRAKDLGFMMNRSSGFFHYAVANSALASPAFQNGPKNVNPKAVAGLRNQLLEAQKIFAEYLKTQKNDKEVRAAQKEIAGLLTLYSTKNTVH